MMNPTHISIRSFLNATLVLSLMLAALTSHARSLGGEAGGGTTATLDHSGELVSFDIFINDESFVESRPSSAKLQLRGQKNSIEYSSDNSSENKGIPVLVGNAADQTFYPMLVQLINRWSMNSPVITTLIKRALQKTQFILVDDFEKYPGRFPVQMKASSATRNFIENYYSLDLGNKSKPKLFIPVASYIATYAGFFLDRSQFDKLGPTSQLAVFLKEAIRRIQTIDSDLSPGGRPHQMSNQMAQYLVYRILLTKPDNSVSLDNPDLYWGNSLKSTVSMNFQGYLGQIQGLCANVQQFEMKTRGFGFYQQWCGTSQALEELISPKKMEAFCNAYSHLLKTWSWRKVGGLSENDIIQAHADHNRICDLAESLRQHPSRTLLNSDEYE